MTDRLIHARSPPPGETFAGDSRHTDIAQQDDEWCSLETGAGVHSSVSPGAASARRCPLSPQRRADAHHRARQQERWRLHLLGTRVECSLAGTGAPTGSTHEGPSSHPPNDQTVQRPAERNDPVHCWHHPGRTEPEHHTRLTFPHDEHATVALVLEDRA